MHRQSAWTIPDIDDVTKRFLERLAAQEGTTVGRCIQLLVMQHVSAPSGAETGIRQQLVPVLQQIVAAVDAAASLLGEAQAARPVPAKVESTRKVPALAEPELANEEADRPTFDEIQDWLRRVDANRAHPKSAKTDGFARAFLRRTG